MKVFLWILGIGGVLGAIWFFYKGPGTASYSKTQTSQASAEAQAAATAQAAGDAAYTAQMNAMQGAGSKP